MQLYSRQTTTSSHSNRKGGIASWAERLSGLLTVLLVSALVTVLVGLVSGQGGGHGTRSAAGPRRAHLVDQANAIVPATAPAVALVSFGASSYAVVTADGGVYDFGGAPFYGAAASYQPTTPIVGAAGTKDGQGYSLVGADGGIFAFGDAGFFGSMGGHPLNAPIVGIAATPSGNGYWLVAADGGIFAFGDAPFLGSMGGHPLNMPVVGMSVGGGGYRLVARDGGIFSFGAPFYGGMGGVPLTAAIQMMATTPSGNGYWLLGFDGAIYCFGDAGYSGRTSTNSGLISPAPAPVTPPSTGPLGGPGGLWHLAFDDEFQGTTLDASKWSVGWFGSGITQPVNSTEIDCYDPSQVNVNNGLDLTIVARPENCGGQTRPYASGLISTNGKFEFTYGYVEARITVPASSPGVIANWPAFWTDGQSWPTDGEMDVLEGLGGQACWHFHSPQGGPGGCASGDFTGTHTYGADWQPGRVDYYYDGQLVGSVTQGITGSPMYLILVNAIDGQNGGPQLAPAQMHVDYVRVWQ